jgi:DNA helicase INO80
LQILEAKRQQRKLNFLITQTELYSHFMANKIDQKDSKDGANKGKEILDKLNEEKPSRRLAELDNYECDAVKRQVVANASKAVRAHIQQTRVFDAQTSTFLEDEPVDIIADDVEEAKPVGTLSTDENKETDTSLEREQPKLFQGTLKKYQLKGMNWLLDLYDQGINGILADEMGLGKTVQSIAMLAHIAEKYNIWGPFLVISPASTLHNWQQEIARFLPAFKVVPYWGSPQGMNSTF